jgi:phosphoribosylglycinamide formyltransferase-1
MPRLALFASGNGTNVQRIADYFNGHPEVSVRLIVCNKPGAYVLTRAEKLGIPAVVFDRLSFYTPGKVLEALSSSAIDFIVLAGFLWLVPPDILASFPSRIINIHPALLPKYGGKGMYGVKVYEAVIAAGDSESGITIHYVNERYDEGQYIFQASCAVLPGDTPESLAIKIHELEYRHFPKVIERLLQPDQEVFPGQGELDFTSRI